MFTLWLNGSKVTAYVRGGASANAMAQGSCVNEAAGCGAGVDQSNCTNKATGCGSTVVVIKPTIP